MAAHQYMNATGVKYILNAKKTPYERNFYCYRKSYRKII
jgi:hypothetical protein